MKTWWACLSSSYRRLIAVGGSIVVIIALALVLATVFGREKKPRPRAVARKDIAREVLTNADAYKINTESLAARIDRLDRENSEMKKRLEEADKQIGTLRSRPEEIVRADESRVSQRVINEVLGRIGTQEHKRGGIPPEGGVVKAPPSGAPGAVIPAAPPSATPPVAAPLPRVEWDKAPPPSPAPAAVEPPAGAPGATGKPLSEPPRPRGRVIVEKPKTADSSGATAGKPDPAKKGANDSVFLPAGTIVSGTLLTGLDAPTAQVARENPHPVLLRIKHEALLPNRFRADVRECFLIASGYGDLSSERAYLRAETISCVREDGGVIEAPIDMYATGEDGKAGVRGPLVSKQGTLLARSLVAGFAEGFASVFRKAPVPTIATTVQGSVPYQAQVSRDALQAGAFGGISSALDRIAAFYLELAQNIFPVVEIHAGRAIDFVSVRGIQLKLRS